jgi:type II restriction/modification system DNA methylase subunit YeeA
VRINTILDVPMEELITRQVFGRTEPPRWVMLVSFSQLLLLDRTKWHEKRLLRFDLREILDRREQTTLQAATALLHKDSICPSDGIPLLDTLDENSHKHAFAVSEDLKYSLRKAIELLGNEAVYYLREVRKEKVYDKEGMAGNLTRECLRYMYRLLFLFYIEARPELGYLPNKSEQYRKGYALESLRDLEMVQLSSEESKNRFFLHESIKILFQLLYEGDPIDRQLSIDMVASGGVDTFTIAPLRSHLFDPKQTPLLNKVKFRNFVLQEVIQLMSLSREKRGRNNRRGRISYAQLGINQLGAVYEALLSYQGFFAETKLYEVKKAKEKHNVLETAYFVKEEDIEQYTEDERVYNKDGSLTTYEKGTFIYRLAGRDREKSASYYTPEVLTKCLVKYALKELLKDKTADEILQLTVCEPAMGSAAFLNEAVNQLAKVYLDLKQKETDELISHEDYPQELQKVKMYIADNNVYGVDLNPVAAELAEVSLWLNTIYEGGFVPWFGMQLVCGNSLIGARRQVFSASLLKKQKRGEPSWLDEVPVRVMPGDKREPDTVYHFLLPDKGMADYKDKVIKQMAGDEIKAINEWRKEFTEPFSESEIKQLKKLSAAIDKLWQRHADMQREIDDRTTDPLLNPRLSKIKPAFFVRIC